ncbi:hypothetical protein [Dyella sp. Tek66A03]|uniref:hypothetical protein n=1 Tax=Dyella sp. Tek66A03 TaxID=3458298 RepID=UPI00403ECE28
MDKVISVLSGEFFLNHRPNGGTAVLLRSVWVTALIYALVIPIKSYCGDHAIFQFSAHQLKKEIGETLPWLGAIFAGVYAAFYSRFAAQWNYLATLYNQLVATCAPLSKENREDNEVLNAWRAAFVEDALDLHLARKSMFRSVVIGMLRRPQVVATFLASTKDGERRIMELEKQLDFEAAKPPQAAPTDLGTAQLEPDLSNVVELKPS